MADSPRFRRILVDALQVAPEFSGIGHRVMELGRDLSRRPPGVPIEVRCARDVAGILRDEFPEGTKFSTPLRSSRPRLVRIAFQQLLSPFLDDGETLVVSPGDQAPILSRAAIILVLHDVRRVTRPRTSGSLPEAFFYWAIIRLGVRRAAAILTVSRFSRDEIVRLYRPAAPIEVITSRLEPRAPAQRDDLPGAPILVVGALRPYKGLETLIRALAYIRWSGGEAPRVICVGAEEDGSGLTSQLRALAAELGVSEHFELRGWVPDTELEQLYEQCGASVNPSEYEGYGLAVAESLGGGLATIASDIPPHREIGGEAALYFEPGNVRALADAIVSVTSEPLLRQRLREAAVTRAPEIGRGAVSWGEAIGNATGARVELR